MGRRRKLPTTGDEEAPASKRTKKGNETPVQKSKPAPKKRPQNTTKGSKPPSIKGNIATIPNSKSPSGSFDDLASYLNDDWRELLKPALESEAFAKVIQFLNSQTDVKIFPSKDLIFNAFNMVPVEKVKVIILGQDPYHDDGQAHGLSFSVPPDVKVPQSLKTLFKELTEDPEVKFTEPTHGCLENWAKQGVLLLNAFLTVEAHKPKSHRKAGWKEFTDETLRLLSQKHKKLVFILWGKDAQQKRKSILGSHVILEGAHPSTLTCGKFYGCRHFSKTNKELTEPIDWQL